MNSRQLSNIMSQLETLKTSGRSEEFKAGVDAAGEAIERLIQQVLDQERMQALEAELAELHAKYRPATEAAPNGADVDPKR